MTPPSHHPPSDLDVSLMRPQVTPDAEAYANAYTTPDSPVVKEIVEETQHVTPFPVMIGGSKEARFLQALVMLTGATRVLEFGTFTGATAVAIAEALPADGRVTTLEHDPEISAPGRRLAESSGLANKIEFLTGDARELIQDLHGPFDIVFIDALKAQYVEYYEATLPKLADDGVIVADNVIWWGLPFNDEAHDSETEGMRRFVRHVNDDQRTKNVVLTVGDGLMLIWKT